MRNGPYELVVAPPDYPGMRYRGRYCYEHTLVWWQNTGEIPGPDEIIHHKNENKRDNRFENFEKKTRGEHTAEHARERDQARHGGDDPTRTATCDYCGREFSDKRSHFKSRSKQTKSGMLFCSRRCSGLGTSPMRPRRPPTHGTTSGYAYHGCRCDLCRAANAKHKRDQSARRRSAAKMAA